MRMNCLVTCVSLSFVTMSGMAQVGDAGPDQFICGTATTLQANIPATGESGFWYGGAPSVVFADPADPFTGVSGLAFGVNELTWVHVAPTGATSDLVAIWTFDPGMPMANAGPDQVIVAPMNMAQLAGSIPAAPGSCQWIGVGGTFVISNPNDPFAVLTDLSLGWTTLQWSCDNGACGSSTDEVTIEVILSTGIHASGGDQPSALAYNPVNRELHVLNGATVEALDVFDGRGRCIISTNAGARITSMIDRPGGIYVARAIVDGRPVVQRFVVGY